MNFSRMDDSFSDYVWEKNRKRIQNDDKYPMFSSPVSVYRWASSVDDIRRDTINKMIATTALWQWLCYALSPNTGSFDIVTSVLTSSIIILSLQASKMKKNVFWHMISKNENGHKWRILMGSIFLIRWMTDILPPLLINMGIDNATPFIQSFIYHYLWFHLIFTRDDLPKMKEEENSLVTKELLSGV